MAHQHPQDIALQQSLKDPETFWDKHAKKLVWTKPYSRVLDYDKKTGEWEWFVDGEISCVYNCLDRHVNNGLGDKVAIIWDSPVTNTVRKVSYRELLDEVQVFAAVLRDLGVNKGDTVLIYMPMIVENIVGILACNRLGAVHSVVFGGFSALETTKRIDSCCPKVILTASCGIEGAKGPQPYKPLIEEAVRSAKSSARPAAVVYLNRPQVKISISQSKGEYDWSELIKKKRESNQRVEDCVATNSSDEQYIIYTSGTTGLPKGVVRDVGGHTVGLHYLAQYLFGLRGPGDVIFTASDLGWVVGHSWIAYGPLLNGCTSVLFEGKPIGTPDAATFWRIIEQHKVNVMFTAPTALRAIKREDPDLMLLKKRNIRSLRALFLAGERSEPNIVQTFQDVIAQQGAPGATVVDNWWSSESGSPISGLALDSGMSEGGTIVKPLAIKPGSAGKIMPGWNVKVVSDDGEDVQDGSMGNIVLQAPLAPTAFRRLWADEGGKRFQTGYLKRFQGRFIDTGDAGYYKDGYIHVMSRSDDIINVAAHRFSTSSIEQAITSHPAVAECAVVGIPDDVKGHVPFAFCTLALSQQDKKDLSADALFKEANQRVRAQIGAIASLGGLICGTAIIPKTRSGKTIRRTLRELVENGVKGVFEDVSVPPTVEDMAIVQNAKQAVIQYFQNGGSKRIAMEFKAKL